MLRDNTYSTIQWDAFTQPELHNFIQILQREEEIYADKVDNVSVTSLLWVGVTALCCGNVNVGRFKGQTCFITECLVPVAKGLWLICPSPCPLAIMMIMYNMPRPLLYTTLSLKWGVTFI